MRIDRKLSLLAKPGTYLNQFIVCLLTCILGSGRTRSMKLARSLVPCGVAMCSTYDAMWPSETLSCIIMYLGRISKLPTNEIANDQSESD